MSGATFGSLGELAATMLREQTERVARSCGIEPRQVHIDYRTHGGAEWFWAVTITTPGANVGRSASRLDDACSRAIASYTEEGP
jgi:hypothetical protein